MADRVVTVNRRLLGNIASWQSLWFKPGPRSAEATPGLTKLEAWTNPSDLSVYTNIQEKPRICHRRGEQLSLTPTVDNYIKGNALI